MDEHEEWRAVVGYPGCEHYEVSSLGRVRNMKRPGKIRKTRVREEGYADLSLYKADGIEVKVLAHRLVALAFHGLPPEGHECAHKDGSKDNNHVDNVTWKTHSNNQLDRRDHKTVGPGYGRQGAAPTTKEQRDEIRGFGLSVPARILAAKYGVSRQAISNIRNYTNKYDRDLRS